jgi:hypothetical protein
MKRMAKSALARMNSNDPASDRLAGNARMAAFASVSEWGKEAGVSVR